MDIFWETYEQRKSQFEGFIFLQESFVARSEFRNYAKNLMEANFTRNSIVYADFLLEQYRQYKNITDKLGIGK